MAEAISRDNPGISSYWMWSEVVDPKRNEIAKKLTNSKQSQCRSQLQETFSPLLLSSMSQDSVDALIDSFMQDDIQPLADALTDEEYKNIQEDLKKQLVPSSTTEEIAAALEGNPVAIEKIAKKETDSQLQEVKNAKDILETGFRKINFGDEEKTSPSPGKCFWVPASVRHEVEQKGNRGVSRYSFFVYGGVSLQPNLNIIKGNGGPLGGSPIGGGGGGGNSGGGGSGSGGGGFNRKAITQGFQDHHIISHTNQATMNHKVLELAGFNNLHARINRIFLPGKDASHPTRSAHSGRHTKVAMDNVAEKMDLILKEGEAKSWSQPQYRAALREMLIAERKGLKAGSIDLYEKSRPEVSKAR